MLVFYIQPIDIEHPISMIQPHYTRIPLSCEHHWNHKSYDFNGEHIIYMFGICTMIYVFSCCIWRITPGKILQYLRARKVIKYSRSSTRVWKLPVTVHGNEMLVFSVKSDTNDIDIDMYHVCSICDRGFATFEGLCSHVTDPAHASEENAAISKIKKVNC